MSAGRCIVGHGLCASSLGLRPPALPAGGRARSLAAGDGKLGSQRGIQARTGPRLPGMAPMNRVRVGWSNFSGQPGLSTFYLSDSVLDVTALKTFLTSMAAFLPGAVTLTVPSLGDKIESSDGSIAGSWVGTGGGQIAASGGAAVYAGSAGIVVDWKTATIVARKRVQGRTFFVPAAQAAYQNDGTIAEATRTTIGTAAATLIAAYTPNLLVWARPFPGRAALPGPPPKPAVPARSGTAAPVVLGIVPDMAAVLRSRRV